MSRITDSSPKTVSIRSRRMSAGESRVAHRRDCRSERFNPLPPNVGGRMSKPWRSIKVLLARFNPLPPNVGGRIIPPMGALPQCSCFNPLPPNVGGRIRVTAKPGAAAPAFQSAPAECRRENIEREYCDRNASRFNPLPPNVGGRMPAALTGRAGRVDVSIRSRRMSAGE